MADKVSYVYLRLSSGARHSDVTKAAAVVENMMGAVTLEPDGRDTSVYCFALPSEIDTTQTTRIISALVTTPYIDEAWQNDVSIVRPQPQFAPE